MDGEGRGGEMTIYAPGSFPELFLRYERWPGSFRPQEVLSKSLIW